MYNLWKKLKNLKVLNNYLASYSQKLQQASQKLEITQASLRVQPMDQSLIDQEKATLLEIAKWRNIEELALRQKSKSNWITSRDSNSKYFHAQCKIRASRNTITSVYADNGSKITDPVLVETEFISFFTKHMGTAAEEMPCLNSETIRRGPCLSYQQKFDLIRDMTNVEILAAIKGVIMQS
ncbi:uncharacterized protein LOC132611870 [Lycium barbarum]|uniref:uncharacterized protein LOC132611870 n=1 Tax=Lycium barbarum TaxID=112863 RepID=UPI00293E795B|nr:uncharacterized protein LOC132611870 [Lycium barbarum]